MALIVDAQNGPKEVAVRALQKLRHVAAQGLAQLTELVTLTLYFTCESSIFRSGAEGIRTPDLRRAKADSYCRDCSPVFKNPCK